MKIGKLQMVGVAEWLVCSLTAQVVHGYDSKSNLSSLGFELGPLAQQAGFVAFMIAAVLVNFVRVLLRTNQIENWCILFSHHTCAIQALTCCFAMSSP